MTTVPNPVGGVGPTAPVPTPLVAGGNASSVVGPIIMVIVLVILGTLVVLSLLLGSKDVAPTEKSAEEQIAELSHVKDVGIIGGRYTYQYNLLVVDNQTKEVVYSYDPHWTLKEEEKEESFSASSTEEPTSTPPTKPADDDHSPSGIKFERVFPKGERTKSVSEGEAPLPEKPVVSLTPQPKPTPPKVAEVGEKKKKLPRVRWTLCGECLLGHLHLPCKCGRPFYEHYHACHNVVVGYKWVPAVSAQGRDIRYHRTHNVHSGW